MKVWYLPPTRDVTRRSEKIVVNMDKIFLFSVGCENPRDNECRDSRVTLLDDPREEVVADPSVIVVG